MRAKLMLTATNTSSAAKPSRRTTYWPSRFCVRAGAAEVLSRRGAQRVVSPTTDPRAFSGVGAPVCNVMGARGERTHILLLGQPPVRQVV